jgi:hypothetical protein
MGGRGGRRLRKMERGREGKGTGGEIRGARLVWSRWLLSNAWSNGVTPTRGTSTGSWKATHGGGKRAKKRKGRGVRVILRRTLINGDGAGNSAATIGDSIYCTEEKGNARIDAR